MYYNCRIKISKHLMNHTSLAKKLKPAKRAWKSFTTKLQSKIRSLNLPNTIKTNTYRFINFCSRHFFIPFKQRFLTKFSHRRHSYNHLYYQYHNQNQLRSFSAIYIDNLYAEPLSSSAHAKKIHAHHAETSKGKEVVSEEKAASNKKSKDSVYSVEDAWNAVVASSPQLRCVDERAEEFIYKFREDMKLQREKSLLEFQDMLTRSA
ncbi:Cotton fiber protein [Melia azedarach]|uniref:Cotton fiber protein n=1 Tax=Melia azedarach TaxID=155640 RepID=A0ACC1YHV3_MELAZ|nr:Cotton fiber protein [Melia azedarach]